MRKKYLSFLFKRQNFAPHNIFIILSIVKRSKRTTSEKTKMVYCSSTNTMSSQNETVEVNSLSLCWNTHAGASSQDFLLDGHKLLLSDNDLDSLSSDSESQKNSSLDILDNLLSNPSSSIHHSSVNNTNLAELKPLPPFTGYTGKIQPKIEEVEMKYSVGNFFVLSYKK